MQWYEWYPEVLKKYAVFDGRAHRAEFWWFVLINFIIAVVLNSISELLGTIYALAVLLPAIGVGIRRLHDTGRTGWWLLVSLIPLIGTIILIVFYVQDSQPGTNEYGPNPKETAGEQPA